MNDSMSDWEFMRHKDDVLRRAIREVQQDHLAEAINSSRAKNRTLVALTLAGTFVVTVFSHLAW